MAFTKLYWVSIFITLFTHSVNASELAVCEQDTVFEISVPVRPTQKNGVTTRYRYQFIKGLDADGPTLIQLPGGPGQTGISERDENNQNWNTIHIDPRGAGCNKSEFENYKDTFSTEVLASDVLSLIKNLNLKKYIIHGVSYGTVWATVLANMMAETNYPSPPEAIILEGTLGHYFHSENHYGNEYVQQWEIFKEKLKPHHLELLTKENLLDIDSKGWGQIIFNFLLMGTSKTQENPLQAILEVLHNFEEVEDPSKNSYLTELFKGILLDLVEVSHEDIDKDLHIEIYCREFTSSYHDSQFFLEGGHFFYQNIGVELCEGIGPLTLYDSKDYQIQYPLFYIQGERDPATPLRHARYHFENQKSLSPKKLIVVPDAGHSPLAFGLEDCRDDLLTAIVSGQSVEPILKKCEASPSLEMK